MSNIQSSNAFLIVNDQVFRIKDTETKIGRSLGNHLVITDPMVSREHAIICFEENKFELRDLNSTGGTFLNGKKVKKGALKSGDSILLSGVPIVFAQNIPQLNAKSKGATGELELLGPDNKPTLPEKELDWRK